MLLAALAALAIVTQDQTALRASPRDSAQQQAVLWQGDALEIRGRRTDYLQVYDHRRERAGYVLASQVRTTDLEAREAPELLAVLRLLRDLPGEETLGTRLALAVQPLDTWRELWLFEHVGNTWIVETLPPDSGGPGIGYAEFAGWVPGDRRILIAREYRHGTRWHRCFEVLQIDTLAPSEHVGEPAASGTFRRWQSPAWKQQTVALR